MSLDPQARSCFGFCHKSRQKNNRCSMQCRIGLNPRRDFAAIRFRHRNIEQDKVRLKILRGLMSLGRVILFKDEVAARLLQRQLGGASKIVVVINNQDARLIFDRFKGLRKKVCFNDSIHNVFRRVVVFAAESRFAFLEAVRERVETHEQQGEFQEP